MERLEVDDALAPVAGRAAVKEGGKRPVAGDQRNVGRIVAFVRKEAPTRICRVRESSLRLGHSMIMFLTSCVWQKCIKKESEGESMEKLTAAKRSRSVM